MTIMEIISPANSQQLHKAITDAGTLYGWDAFGVAVGSGIVAMAILQLSKDMAPWRRHSQRKWMQDWIIENAGLAERRSFYERLKRVIPVSAQRAEDRLVDLATGGSQDAFYELPVEQMVAQMNAAAQVALDNPKTYFDLLRVLASGADNKDLATIDRANAPKVLRRPDTSAASNYLEARNRVGHWIQRNLDAVQIEFGNRWKFQLQVASILLSIVLVEASVYFSSHDNGLGTYLLAAPIGLVGGYLAPVFRDVIASLQSLRK